MQTFEIKHAIALYVRFCAIYAEKFAKHYHTEDFKKIWYEEWATGLAGIDVNAIKSVLEHCKINFDWPPSISEFRKLCEQASGMPSETEAMQLAIRGEFAHPIVRMSYESVGSWAMKNDKQDALTKKFQEAYRESLIKFRSNPSAEWVKIEDLNKKTKELPSPQKKTTKDEIKSFREKLSEYQAKAKSEEKGIDMKMEHPIWDKKKITWGGRNFDADEYKDRRDYLVKLPEYHARTLDRDEWYDRIRYLREIEAERRLKYDNDTTYAGSQKKSRHGSNFNNARVYKNWMDD